MRVLIPFAKPARPNCLQALSRLQLPHLSALLGWMEPATRHTCAEDSLTPLAERLQAQAMGLPTQDGLVPWAALHAQQLRLPTSRQAPGWAWITPCHWQVNTDHVRMADPAQTQISEADSRTVMEAMQAFFAEDGIALHGWHQGHWLAQGRAFADLPTASLARAAGSTVDHWMPRQEQASALRRLQNEMQMLLYNHPVNDARAAAGLLPITSFWVSGTGHLPDGFDASTAQAVAADMVHTELQSAALADDASGWTQAWQALDATTLAPLLPHVRAGQPLELTLCAQNSALTLRPQPAGLWTRIRSRLARANATALLQTL